MDLDPIQNAQNHSDVGTSEDPGVRLMLAYQRGDESAFDRLVEEYSGQVYALLTRFLGPVARREDLLQEVFLRVIRARNRYRATARLSTWLYRIAFNLCANESQRASGALLEDLGTPGERMDWVDEQVEEPSVGLERQDVVVAVQDAIARLPDGQRMALLLAKYDGLAYAEIAKVLDSSEKAVKSLIHRARENLRAILTPLMQEEGA